MDYMSTNFGADSSSRFRFRVQKNRQTDRQTDVTKHSTPRQRLLLPAWLPVNEYIWSAN